MAEACVSDGVESKPIQEQTLLVLPSIYPRPSHGLWAVPAHPHHPAVPARSPASASSAPTPQWFHSVKSRCPTVAYRPLQPNLCTPFASLLSHALSCLTGLLAVSGTRQAPTPGPLYFLSTLPSTRYTGPGYSVGHSLISIRHLLKGCLITDTFPSHLTLNDNCSLSPAFLPVSHSALLHSTFQ